jgi:hypothetical protein
LKDDGGAPLLCELAAKYDPPIQLGLFQSLTLPANIASDSEIDPLEKCRMAREMRFSFFYDDVELAQAIERHALAEFVMVILTAIHLFASFRRSTRNAASCNDWERRKTK